jgi:hypothetical protein
MPRQHTLKLHSRDSFDVMANIHGMIQALGKQILPGITEINVSEKYELCA